MSAKTELSPQVLQARKHCESESANEDDVLRFKKRILEWPNPVEYVNNMYGCHPDDDDNEYFKVIFAK